MAKTAIRFSRLSAAHCTTIHPANMVNSIPEAVKRTMALDNPMQLVDEASIDQLLEIAAGDQADCLKLLAELKPVSLVTIILSLRSPSYSHQCSAVRWLFSCFHHHTALTIILLPPSYYCHHCAHHHTAATALTIILPLLLRLEDNEN